MADYPTVTAVVNEGVVTGHNLSQGPSEAHIHVLPSAREPGAAVLAIKTQKGAVRVPANALVVLDDAARLQLIKLLGGIAQ